jgi:hypothetical protein
MMVLMRLRTTPRAIVRHVQMGFGPLLAPKRAPLAKLESTSMALELLSPAVPYVVLENSPALPPL